MKTCSNCKKDKPVTSFYNRRDSKDGKAYRCIACLKSLYFTKEKNKEEYIKNGWKRHLKNRYNLTIIEYNKMVEAQKGTCKICKSKDIGNKARDKLHVDHCHTSGKIRGLLCDPCNRGLGAFKDNIKSMKSAIGYLNENR